MTISPYETPQAAFTRNRDAITKQIEALTARLARLDADHAAAPTRWDVVGDAEHIAHLIGRAAGTVE